jgi:hypothetical protein
MRSWWRGPGYFQSLNVLLLNITAAWTMFMKVRISECPYCLIFYDYLSSGLYPKMTQFCTPR